MMRVAATVLLLLSAQIAAAMTIDATIYTKRGEVPLTLEVAATPKARATGLMDRDTIGAADGMIFLFPEPTEQAFWMKNTRVPLDMLFIDEDCRIIRLLPNVPPFTLEPRHSGGPASAVIELAGGRAAVESIDAGDHVRYELPDALDIR